MKRKKDGIFDRDRGFFAFFTLVSRKLTHILAALEPVSLTQPIPLQPMLSSWLGDAAGEAGFDD